MASDNNISSDDAGSQIQNRLLEAAERLFCEKGFAGTSVRDITSEAKCNVAAVNYHFGGKENLYKTIVQHHLRNLRDVRLASIKKVMSEPDVNLEKLLHSFAAAFVEPLIDQDKGDRFMKMMIREMLDPHLPKNMFADEVAIPTLNKLGGALMELCPNLNQKQAIMAIISIVGQLVHTIHLKKVFDTQHNIEIPVPAFPEMIDHIIEFSAAGIRSLAKGES